MRWIPDTTHRFSERPLFEQIEIERLAKCTVVKFLPTQEWTVDPLYRIDDDLLSRMAESMTDSVDFDASLEDHIDAYTIFGRTGTINMYINRDLSNSSSVNRRRFTIAHEIGHVVLHQAIFTRNASQTSFLPENQPPVTCMRSRIDRPSADWIEWQAYYFASCLLMPARSVLEHARHFTGTSLSLPIVADSEALSLLVESVANYFCVSEAATEVRLNQLGIGMENVQSELLCSHASPSSPDAA